MASDLDQQQILQQAFDETSGRLKVDAEISSTIIAPPGLEVAINAADDNIAIRNSNNSNELLINANGSINVGNFPSTFGVTQSTSPWVISGTTGRNWTLSSVTDSVNVGNFPAVQSVSQSTNPWIISGTVTSNIGTTGGLALDSSLSTINTTLGSPFQTGGSISNTSFIANQSTASNLNATVIGTGTFAVQAVQSGTWNINNVSGTISLPTGASTSANQGTANTSLSSIDSKVPSNLTVSSTRLLVDNSGVVQPVSQSGTWSVRNQDGSGNAISSQTSNSQTALNVLQPDRTNLSQNITANAQTVAVSTVNMGCVMAQITGSWTGTLQFEATVDGSNYASWVGFSNLGFNWQSSITSVAQADIYLFPVAGIQNFRVRASAWTSGTATISLSASQAFSGSVLAFTGYPGDVGAFPVTLKNTNIVTDSLAQGATTSGQAGNLSMGAVTTAAPSYTTAKTNPLSLSTAGGLRVDLEQINGVALLAGAGNTGTGSPRVTISTDQAILTNAWKSNVAQINGITPLMGNGVTGTGSQRVTIASDNTAFTVNAAQSGTWTVQPGNTANTTPWLVTLTDGIKATYSASTLGIASAVAATDIFTITGSGTKTIRITKIAISGTQTTASDIDVQIIKRSTANSSGTSASVTAVSHDSSDAAATATVLSYTANPTLGNIIGAVRTAKIFVPAILTISIPSILEYDFGSGPEKTIVLRGTSEVLAVNLNGQTIIGSNFNLFIEWSEE